MEVQVLSPAHIQNSQVNSWLFLCAEPAWGGLEARLRYFEAKLEISNWGSEPVRFKSYYTVVCAEDLKLNYDISYRSKKHQFGAKIYIYTISDGRYL
jgi:hypothetical protein